MDYMTLGTAERLFPYKHINKIEELRKKATFQIINNNNIKQNLLSEISSVEKSIDIENMKVIKEIINEIKNKVIKENINCIGFKLWSQPSLKYILYIARELKKLFPKILFFCGGPHIDYFLEDSYNSFDNLFDFCIYADGEIAIDFIPKYLNNLIELSDIPNIIYKDNKTIIKNECKRLNSLKYEYNMNFDKDIYPAAYSDCEKVKLVPIENTRGCNFKCEFCIHPIKSGFYREKNIEELWQEISYLNKKYGFINFYACGSNTSHKNCINILKKAFESGNNYILSFFQSTRDFDISNKDFLKKVHVGFFWIGIETASKKISESQINNFKNISKSEKVCLLLNDIGIRHYDSYIYPMPGGDDISEKETLDLINRIDSEWVVIYPPLLQPRTSWLNKKNKFIEFLDKKTYIAESMFGIEEYENKIFPPIVTNKKLGLSVNINGKSYLENYYEHICFKYKYNKNNLTSAHNYKSRKLNLSNIKNVFYTQHDKMTKGISYALKTGDFTIAKKELTKYNKMCTSGSIKNINKIFNDI